MVCGIRARFPLTTVLVSPVLGSPPNFACLRCSKPLKTHSLFHLLLHPSILNGGVSFLQREHNGQLLLGFYNNNAISSLLPPPSSTPSPYYSFRFSSHLLASPPPIQIHSRQTKTAVDLDLLRPTLLIFPYFLIGTRVMTANRGYAINYFFLYFNYLIMFVNFFLYLFPFISSFDLCNP